MAIAIGVMNPAATVLVLLISSALSVITKIMYIEENAMLDNALPLHMKLTPQSGSVKIVHGGVLHALRLPTALNAIPDII